MNITKYLAQIVMLICVLAFTAFAGNRDTSADLYISFSASHDPVLQPNLQPTTVPELSALGHAVMVLTANKTWVKESVGMTPLNVFRRPFCTIKSLDGYGDVLLKPKITLLIAGNNGTKLNAFTGLGHEHYARADV